jgi:tyrosyl-tRNA synthetase
MDDATIEANSEGIEAILRALLTQRGAPVPGMLLNNLEWFAGMGFLEFLRDVGRFARMGTMLNKDSVKTRLDGDGMSFTEFSYQLLQGYDLVHLSYDWSVIGL